MLKRTKSCFVVRMRSYIIVEDQVHHLVILVGMDTVGGGVIETKGGIGNHPIIIKSEKGILSRKEQFLHLPTRLEEKSKVGGGGERGFRGPLPHSRVLATPHVSSKDSISKAQNWISQSPFSEEIEKIDLPKRFTRPTFTIYNGKTDSMEHVSHYNQSMAIYFE